MEPVSVGQSLTGLGSFLLYFVSSLVFLVLFKWLYPLITPHKEWQLVREERNTAPVAIRSEEHTSELQSRENLVCRLLLEKKKIHKKIHRTTLPFSLM